jgi:hypothetical protein
MASRYGRQLKNILNKQSRTADKGGPPAWGLGEVLTTPHHRNLNMLRVINSGLGTGLILRYNLERAFVRAVMNFRVP